MHRRTAPILASLALAATSFITTGCIVAGEKQVEVQGKQISNQTLDRITPGETSRRQVVNLIGAPTRVTNLGPGKMVYVYEFSETTVEGTAVFLIFSGESRKTEAVSTYIEFDENEIVVEIWRDGR